MAAILLTGASGFVGIHVIRQLLDQDRRVRALVRTPEKLRTNLALLGIDGDDPRIEAVPGDMTDQHAVRHAANGCDQAIHAATKARA